MTVVQETDAVRLKAFLAYIASGGKVEATDWMPEEYRVALLRFIEMHANSELMGVLPEREWIMRAPSLQRKLALTAKVQDEVGHAQLLYRLAEDLGKSRAQMMDDLLAGRTKFHNVFHYPTHSWGDVGVIAWLVDAAAILSQKALLGTSYAPYARTMQRICWEESFHIKHGYDIVVTLAGGAAIQRAMLQDALNRWWGPLMQMHGPPTPPERDRDLTLWRIKTRANESLRQDFIATYVPRVWQLGLSLPDPALRQNADGSWSYSEPNWDELRTVVSNHGPRSAERLAFRRLNYEQGAWVREMIDSGENRSQNSGGRIVESAR
jgi:ring-1,2-phenylacetyl-CoA epoxidase subunit PaaA